MMAHASRLRWGSLDSERASARLPRDVRPADAWRLALATGLALAAMACAVGPVQPQQPDSRNDLCTSCRMPVSDPSLAAQIVAPNEEPRFFDDLQCLREYLAQGSSLPDGATVYVADHRTRDWVKARQAVFASVPALQTPMGSHWAAYADEDSRQADAQAVGSSLLPASAVFGAAAPPGE